MAIVPTPNSAGLLLNLSMSQESKDLRWFSKLLNDTSPGTILGEVCTLQPLLRIILHKTAIEFALKQFPKLILLRNPLSV